MKLAKIIRWDDCAWRLADDTRANPPVSTVVQYTYDMEEGCYVVYFPGYTAGCYIPTSVLDEYFKDLTVETG